MNPQEDQDVLVFGLDFGTTCSGVAWAYSKDSEAVATITSWHTQQSHCSDKDKAPSKISFADDDHDKVADWGYNATGLEKQAKWFKLLLLDEKDVPINVLHSDQYKEAVQIAEDLGKSAVELITCYLKEIWLHTLDVIERSEGAEFLEICEFQVVVTLPAIWPEYSKKRMKEALKKAGILDRRNAGPTTVRFISEPEAAALATITDMGNRPTLQPGQTMIVCDAGGGTVDLITYEIQEVKPFVVKEIVKGDGELCGGVFLDHDFVTFIKQKIGANNWKLLQDTEKQKFLNSEWENGIKPQFSDKEDREWPLTVPEAQAPTDGSLKRTRSLAVSTEDLRKVFAPVTERIVELVKRQGHTLFAQTSKKPNHVVLVGGFGRCRHLYNYVKAAATGFGATLLQPQGSKPWSAISRGAVIHGLTRLNLTPNIGVTVSSRVARASYGVKYSTNFDKDKHHEDDKVWCPLESVEKANDQVWWFLNKGEDIDDHQPVQRKFYNYLDREQLEILERSPLEIYSTEASPAPSRAKDDRVSLACHIDWAGLIRYSKLPKRRNEETKKMYRKLEYAVRMKCDLGEVEFFIILNGEEYGSGQRIQVDFET